MNLFYSMVHLNVLYQFDLLVNKFHILHNVIASFPNLVTDVMNQYFR
ncbi:unnamed protein product [Schistosoma curassoni]|uniref:Uncharacterized protein n=1 Tax=Schistosoma curassoni TaxID=6186 RepID=A0A183K3I0_9TREM|nr:unnamed protein product [Schistosoma curassoni]